MKNIYTLPDDKFDLYLKENLDFCAYDLIKKYTCLNSEKTNDITKWLYKLYMDKKVPEIDFKIDNGWYYCELFEEYNKLFKSKKIKHIREFNSWEEFYNEILSLSGYETNSEKDKLAKQGAKILAEENNFLLYDITTWEAAIKYGKGTKWCVASKLNPKWFNLYTSQKNKKLMYLIDKTSPKKYGIEFIHNSDKIPPFMLLFNELNDNITPYIPLFKIENGLRINLEPKINKDQIEYSHMELIKWMFKELQKIYE